MINRPPKGGLVPPLSGGIANTAPAPSGAGAEAEGRAGSGGCTPKYYLVVAGGRGSVVDVCSSLKEAERSCRQYQRVVGGSFWVKTADTVSEKWK